MTCHRVCNTGYTTSITSGAGTTYPSGAHDFTPIFIRFRVIQSLVFSVVFCRSLFVLFLLAIVMSVPLRFSVFICSHIVSSRFSYMFHICRTPICMWEYMCNLGLQSSQNILHILISQIASLIIYLIAQESCKWYFARWNVIRWA
jgi:hypothetical protein